MKLRGEMIGLGLIFVGPFALALAIYFGPFDKSALPVVDNPERELVAKATTLGAVELQTSSGEPQPEPWADYRWSLIYVADSPCGPGCREDLARMKQVHDALGHDRDRVRRVFLYRGLAAPELDADRGLALGPLGAGAAEALALGHGARPRVFVADPLGNVVLSYPAGAERRALLEDLERLLDVSRIG